MLSDTTEATLWCNSLPRRPRPRRPLETVADRKHARERKWELPANRRLARQRAHRRQFHRVELLVDEQHRRQRLQERRGVRIPEQHGDKRLIAGAEPVE